MNFTFHTLTLATLAAHVTGSNLMSISPREPNCSKSSEHHLGFSIPPRLSQAYDIERVSCLVPELQVIQDVQQRLTSISKLQPGWDTYQSQRPSDTACAQAKMWISQYADGTMPTPSVVPCADGSVQIEWHTNDVNFDVTFKPDGSSEFFFEDLRNSETTDGDLIHDVLDVRKLLLRLGN